MVYPKKILRELDFFSISDMWMHNSKSSKSFDLEIFVNWQSCDYNGVSIFSRSSVYDFYAEDSTDLSSATRGVFSSTPSTEEHGS